MAYIPAGIRSDIVRRLGRQGFRELASFIAAGPDGRDAVYEREVLEEVDLDEFIFVSSLANEGSLYRPFLIRCLEAGNTTAQYVEGLRLAVKLGPSRHSLDLMKGAEEYVVYAMFAYGVFSICAGNYEEGMESMYVLINRLGWLDSIVQIGDTVMAQISDIEPPMAGNYNATYRFPDGDVPNCIYFACNAHDVCFDCISYWYSRRVRHMC
ncbi:unnamed protein product [Arabidopsis arenosa]|uniref:Uncharacterized protein n=1 Tax=Arabidopsis arenosa TaxID=38785 RepID=A0A8S1ZDL3_ARAAE|nr:unnamed protein product [Arabidopsis arenosa]